SVDSSGNLGTETVVGGITSAGASATVGTATYFVSPTANTLTAVFNNGGEGVTIAATADNSLAGAPPVGVSTARHLARFARESGDTLATFKVVTAANGTHSLVNLQTLRDGDAFGTAGLSGVAAIGVTPDDKYVVAIGGTGNSIAVFQRQLTDQPSSQLVTG